MLADTPHRGRHHASCSAAPIRRPCSTSSSDFIEKNPNTVQALVNAFYKTLKWLEKATPEQIANDVPEEYCLGDKALYLAAVKASMPIYSLDGIIPRGHAERASDMLAQFDKEIAGRQGRPRQDLRRPLREESRGDVTARCANDVAASSVCSLSRLRGRGGGGGKQPRPEPAYPPPARVPPPPQTEEVELAARSILCSAAILPCHDSFITQ